MNTILWWISCRTQVLSLQCYPNNSSVSLMLLIYFKINDMLVCESRWRRIFMQNWGWHVSVRSFLGKIYTCAQSVCIQFGASGQSCMCSVAVWKVRQCYACIISLLPESSRFAVHLLHECSKSSGCAKAWFVLPCTDGDSFSVYTDKT